MTLEQFIFRANEIHGNRYDYSKTIYKNNQTKIEITCRIHGAFHQVPKSHLKGHGCNLCSEVKLCTNSFIRKAKAIHGERYDYTTTMYSHSLKNVEIMCPKHGPFKQVASRHLRGSGCSKCGIETQQRKATSNSSKWTAKAIEVHGDKYDYSDVKYMGAKEKVSIKCKKHGIFQQTAYSHLQGNGCCYCSGVIRTTQRFIEKAMCNHPVGRYTYEHTFYINSTTPVTITCVAHGPFSTNPSDHLRGAGTCMRCQGSSPECKWLDSLNITSRQVRIKIGEQYLKVDGYDENTNTIYEFHGDFWHGNPKVYLTNDINPIRGITYGQLYDNTLARERLIRVSGYNLITMWEYDWNIISDN